MAGESVNPFISCAISIIKIQLLVQGPISKFAEPEIICKKELLLI